MTRAKTDAFDLYVGVDWSGAEPGRTPAIKVAACQAGEAAPELVTAPDGWNWSRSTLAAWLNDQARQRRILAGFDFSFSLPFIDLGGYFPGQPAAPKRARDLWTLVDQICEADADFYARGFARHPDFQRYFHSTLGKGEAYLRRFRLCEQVCRETGFGGAQSAFHLIGPNQVGLGSLAGMRFLSAMRDFAVWPFDASPGRRSVFVEIYCAAFFRMSGAGPVKVDAARQLNIALDYFASRPASQDGIPDDHAADAIASAAALRALAGQPNYWKPRLLSDKVRRTEGWTFGIL